MGMAIVAGGVQGVLAQSFDYLPVKIAVGLASALVLIMAGAISARQTLFAALALGVTMAVAFFVTRWAAWSLMDGGFDGLRAFLTTPPWGWPHYLSVMGISGFWLFEAVSMLGPAMIGCYVGQERAEK